MKESAKILTEEEKRKILLLFVLICNKREHDSVKKYLGNTRVRIDLKRTVSLFFYMSNLKLLWIFSDSAEQQAVRVGNH